MPNRSRDPANLYPYLWVQWSGETVERLIRSTQKLFRERGYVGTSPKAIQRVAETSLAVPLGRRVTLSWQASARSAAAPVGTATVTWIWQAGRHVWTLCVHSKPRGPTGDLQDRGSAGRRGEGAGLQRRTDQDQPDRTGPPDARRRRRHRAGPAAPVPLSLTDAAFARRVFGIPTSTTSAKTANVAPSKR